MRSSRRIRLRRTIDHLTRQHPWLGDVLRNRRLAVLLLLAYATVLLLIISQVYQAAEQGSVELLKTFGPVIFDIGVIFALTVLFLFARTYYADEQQRINRDLPPDAAFFFRLSPARVTISLNETLQGRHPAVAAILSALPMDLDEYFNVHAGALDIPKLTLQSVHLEQNELRLQLGVAAFKEFFFTHHFPDFKLARNGSRDAGSVESLRSLFSAIYARSYKDFFAAKTPALSLLGYTPNTLGVTGLVQVVCDNQVFFVLQVRGYHESAAKGVVQLTYAGTLNAFPAFAQQPSLNLSDMLEDEFCDEFIASSFYAELSPSGLVLPHEHRLVGFCCNSQYLFQPELFALTTLTMTDRACFDRALTRNRDKDGKSGWIVVETLEAAFQLEQSGRMSLRPLCRQALMAGFY